MFRRALSFGGLLIQAGALLLLTPGFGEAAGHGGGHFGGGGFHGGHFGGAHFGGYGGGFSHGGFYGHPYAHYGYHHGYYGGYGYARGRYYPSYGGYYAYPYYGYSGSYDPYSYAVPSGVDDAGYSGSYGDVTPSYADDYPTAGAPAGGYTAFYPPATARPDAGVHVTVNVPADATLWFDDAPTTSTGPVRVFNSPPLAPGTHYTYELRARWNENGHEVTQTQEVGVTAGAHVHVSFPVPPGTAGQAAAVTKG